jgi:ornithine cyclodeaminase
MDAEPLVFTLDQIKNVLDPESLIKSQEHGFVAYSQGRVVVPPVGHLCFDDPPGDCHIKYGHVSDGGWFVVKIATGFYRNPELGLPSSDGLFVVFSKRTGQPQAVLLERGFLTDIRTAAAGAVTAKYLAPRSLRRIGIIGTGIQARMQLDMLRHVTPCREVLVWGRDSAKAELLKSDPATRGYSVEIVRSVAELAAECQLIVTTTAARSPLLYADHIRPGTHVTAVGADGGGKQELHPEVFAKADLKVVDSATQCRDYGEASYAIKAGLVKQSELVELGDLIRDPQLGRRFEDQISVADLTGVAVQDIEAANLVLQRLVGL